MQWQSYMKVKESESVLGIGRSQWQGINTQYYCKNPGWSIPSIYSRYPLKNFLKKHLKQSLWVCLQTKQSMFVRINITLWGTVGNTIWGRDCAFSCVRVCLWLFYQLASWDEAALFRSSYLDASPSVVKQCWEMERGGREMGVWLSLSPVFCPLGFPRPIEPSPKA